MTCLTFARGAAAAAGLLAAALAGSTASAETTTIRLGYSTLLNTGFHLYMGEVAPEIYAGHGITLVPVDMRANAQNCIAALLSGEVDMCSISTPTGMFAGLEGAPLKALAVLQGPLAELYLTREAAERTGVAPDAPVADRLAALGGISVVTSAPGALYYSLLEQMVREGGLTMADLNYRTLVDQVAMREGLANRAFDSALWSAGAFADLEASGDLIGWINIPAGDMPEMSQIPTVTVFATQGWLDANPGKAEDLHAAFVEVIAALRADPARWSPLIKEKNFPDMDQAVWDAAFEAGMKGLWDSATVSEAGWTALIGIQKANNPDTDFDAASWSTMVLPVAQAK